MGSKIPKEGIYWVALIPVIAPGSIGSNQSKIAFSNEHDLH